MEQNKSLHKIRGSLSRTVLELLEHSAARTIDLAWAVAPIPTNTQARRRLWRVMLPHKETIGDQVVNKAKKDFQAYHKYYVTLKRLEKHGLIEARGIGRNQRWHLLPKGKQQLEQEKISEEKLVSMTGAQGLTIISYDIPESKRRERNRLREMLHLLDFEQLHKSVWYGEKKTTYSFLEALKELGILDGVHIFEVNKTGTITKKGGQA